MGVKVREKSRKLYLDVYFQGRRRWEALGLTLGEDEASNRETLRVADICRQKRELQIISGEWGLLDPVEGKRALLDYARDMAADRDPKDHLPKSLRYLEDYGQGVQLHAVNEHWVEGYQKYLLEKGLSRSTAAHYAAALRLVLRRAVRDMVLPRNPAEAVKMITVPESVRVYLTAEELGKLALAPLRGELGAEVKRAFLFASCTGLRISDLRSLTWGEIQRDPLQILKRQGKTGRVVAVPLNEGAWRTINDGTIHRREELVFPILTASKANTNQYLKTWAKAAGVDKSIGWHTALHTFATMTLEAGADFSTVSRMLGHTKLNTTLIYAKTTDKTKRAAVEALPELPNSSKVGKA
jgi:integrase